MPLTSLSTRLFFVFPRVELPLAVPLVCPPRLLEGAEGSRSTSWVLSGSSRCGASDMVCVRIGSGSFGRGLAAQVESKAGTVMSLCRSWEQAVAEAMSKTLKGWLEERMFCGRREGLSCTARVLL